MRRTNYGPTPEWVLASLDEHAPMVSGVDEEDTDDGLMLVDDEGGSIAAEDPWENVN